MIITERKQKYVYEEIGVQCDCCKKKFMRYNDEDCYGHHDKKIKFFGVTVGHREWGNDSVDSIEGFSFCSYECLSKFFESYFNDKYLSDTAYMNITTNVKQIDYVEENNE